MTEFFGKLFSSDFMPHGTCYLWNPAVLWLNVISDAVITLSYYAIPVLLFWFARKRRDLTFHWIFVAFGVFILACGTTHLMGIWTVWHATYRLDGVVKALTAAVSLWTAVLVVPLLPMLVALPSPTELARINRRLSTEIEERTAAEEEVRRMNATLEQRVAERTAELEYFNEQLKESNRDLQKEVMHRRAVEEQLVQAQKMEAVGRLAGGVAHDFNNLLTAVCGYNDLLVDELVGQTKLQQYAVEVQRAALRATALTSQLLAFSRRQVVQPTLVDVGQALGEIEKMLHRIIGEDIDLRIEVIESHAYVRIDRGQLDQIVLNLAVNARDAMPAGGKLTIAVKREEANVTLSVADSGHGIDAETKRRLFEPFFTTKPVGKGTGLGLSIVYGIVKQNKGDILVETEVGSGTTFTILLPEVREAVEFERLLQAEAAMAVATETILVAEDEATVRALVREVLTKKGYHILEASSPREAIRISERFSGKIHLLLTDVVMPEINGAELARRLGGVRPDLKVLFMSGYSDSHLASRILPEEGVAFIQKPFTGPKLVEKIREALSTQTRSS